MRIAIIILLLLPFTSQSQTKWRQIERSLTKWNVPAAFDSIPGQTGYAGKWISLQTLIDTIGIETGGVKGTGAANRVAYWVSSDSLTSNANLTFTSGNIFTLIGRMVLKATTTVGDWNAFINGGNTTLTGNNNIAIGNNQTLQSITTGDNNISLGSVSGLNLTTGDDNVFVGASAGRGNTTGSSNTYIGNISGFTNNGDANTFIGIGAGAIASNVTTNTYVGAYAGYTASNSSNVYLGFYSGFASSNSGSNNVAVGNESSNNGGGSNNVKIGATSGKTNTGSNNVFVGYDSGQASSSKGGNVFIGYQSGRNEDIDNSLIIANSSSTSNGIYGDFDNSKFGVNIAPSSAARTWDVNGELRVRDLTTDNPTKMLGADNDGDVSGVNVGVGLTLSGTTLTADTSKLATPYDLSLMDQSATNEIQTIDTFQIFDTNKLRISLSQDGQVAKVVTLPTGTLTGTGTSGYITRWTGTSSLANSIIQDDGTRATVNGTVDTNYRFKVADGNVKIGDTTFGSYNRIFFGDGTFVSVGENEADDRLHLKGASLTIEINTDKGSDGSVLTSNGTTASWSTPISTTFGQLSLAVLNGETLDGTNRKINFSSCLSNNTTCDTSDDDITVSETGTYKIDFSLYYQLASPYGQTVAFLVCKNGNCTSNNLNEKRIKDADGTSTNSNAVSASFFTNLNANDYIALYYKATAGTAATIDFDSAILSIQRVN